MNGGPVTTNKKPWSKDIPLFRTTSLGRRISAIGLSISELLLVLARDVRRPALQNHVLFHRRLQASFFWLFDVDEAESHGLPARYRKFVPWADKLLPWGNFDAWRWDILVIGSQYPWSKWRADRASV
jgi:hypothetical protein